ncbi:Coiled-coil domain-containing protein [Dirofilaria immitis]
MFYKKIASTAGTSETVEIRGESKNGVSNHLEENELADDFVARQKQFGRKLEMRGSDEEKSSTRIVVVGGMAENMLGKFALLYDKYNAQCNELESLEKANSELKEQLQKVRHEYANTQEVLNRCRSDFSAHCEGLECRIVDVELQLKMTTQRIEAREEHYQQRIKQNDAKWDQKFGQLLKRTEVVEKEKNDAVCRYAAREAQLMRLQTQIETLEVQKNMLLAEKSTLQKSTQFEYVQNMKHSLAEVERQLALEKEASKEREEQYKMTIKHLEANQTVLTELRSRLESVESQRAMEQMEKEDYQQKFRKAQTMLKTLEQQCAEEVDAVIKKTNNQQEQYNNVCDELSSLRSHNSTLSQQLDHVIQANAQLQAESQQLRQNLEQARQNHQIALEKLESLEQMQTQLNSNLRRVKLAEIAAMDAAAERDQAEVEAAECRRQAERMLEITEQLADKNSSLTSQQEMLRFKNLELNQRVKTLESSVSAYEKHIVELDQELNLLKVDNSAKIGALRQQIDANISKEQKLNAVINELRNEQEVLRKKNSSSLKELRAEVQHLRKLQSQSSNLSPTNASDNLSFTVLPNGIASSFTGAVGPSISSRTSSIASSSDICSSTTGYNTILISRTAADQKESQQFIASPSSDETNHLQQQMIEKIVKLQRQLARRQDKIEFLEEHVQQCTQELLKKTKIIQNYALREEASLLLPENDLNKLLETCEVIEMPRRISDNCNTSSPLIGNLFASSTSGMTGKSALKFAAEVNSRLQAVLEDALHKNITLKNNIDILGEEISRLSRENRRLALSKIV